MGRKAWLRMGGLLCGLLGWLCAGTAQASELEELAARLDKLEKENKALQDKLKERPTSFSGPYKPPEPKEPVAGRDDAKVRKIVGDYLEQQDAKKKEEVARKQPEPPQFHEVGSLGGLTAAWVTSPGQQGYGLWWTTPDQAFRFHIGGWADTDFVGVDGPQKMFGPLSSQGIGKFDDGVNFRRTRLRAEGTVWDQFDFLMEFDFSLAQRVAMPGNPVTVTGTTATIASQAGTVADRNNQIGVGVPTDLYLQYRETPLGNIRVGNVKPMYSMEQLQSSRFGDFMEFSYIWDAFLEQGNNGWIPGMTVWGTFGDLNGNPNRFFYGVNVGWSNNRALYVWNQGDGELEESARLGWTVFDEDNGRHLLNLSVGSMHQAANDGSLRYRARFSLRNGNNLEEPTLAQIQGGLSDAFLLQPELFYNFGPFNVVAEWAMMAVAQNHGAGFSAVGNQTTGLPAGSRGELYWNGGYVAVGYFLTGESRSFDRTWKVLDRVIPGENAFSFRNNNGWNFGTGAWQVLARYNYLNMDSKGVDGGILNGLTFGLNWYLNPNTRFMWNFVADHRNAVQYVSGAPSSQPYTQNGWLYGVGARFHFDF